MNFRGRGTPWLFSLALALAPAMASSAGADGPVEPRTPGGAMLDDEVRDGIPVYDPASGALPAPPGGVWRIDARGREYTLFAWPKERGGFRFLDPEERRVLLPHGVEFEVERHDERNLYLRWYNTAPLTARLEAERVRRSQQTEAIRACARQELAASDRLHLVSWDEGLPRRGQWRNEFAVADFNGDGRLDLAHGPARKDADLRPYLFLGDGAGRWRAWEEANFPKLPYDYGDVAAGDLDGDGDADLVLASHRRGLWALLSDGSGGFRSWSSGLPERRDSRESRADGGPAPPAVFSSRAITLADWDGDGRLDILALAEGPGSPAEAARSAPPGKLVFRNRGDGSWEERAGPGSQLGDTIVAVDLDRDGRLDFVTDSRIVGSTELLNHGEPGGSWRVASLPQARERVLVRAIAVADLSADGRNDLALAFRSHEGGVSFEGVDLYVASGDGGPDWRRVPVVALPDDEAAAITALAAGDLDRDGDADLVALTSGGAVELLLRQNDGGFVRELGTELAPAAEHAGCAGYDAALVDLDGDGRAELVAAFAGEPGGEALYAGVVPAQCRAGGALRVWKVVAGPAPASAP